MAQVDLKFDFYSGNPVVSKDDLSIAGLPRFVQGDSLDLRIWIVQRSGSLATYLPVSGVTLFAALGDLLEEPPTYLTNQASWTASTDLANPFFEATLPMNTSDINSALATAAAAGKKFITVDFGVTFYVAGEPTSAILKSVKIHKALITPASVVVPAGQTALTLEVANSMFLSRRTVGRFQLINETDATKINEIFTDTDGSFHSEPVT